jgi:hypothetical protein
MGSMGDACSVIVKRAQAVRNRTKRGSNRHQALPCAHALNVPHGRVSLLAVAAAPQYAVSYHHETYGIGMRPDNVKAVETFEAFEAVEAAQVAVSPTAEGAP